jgi:hypothetical protein
MPTPEQQTEHFKQVASLAGMLEKNGTSKTEPLKFDNLNTVGKKLYPLSDVMDKLTVVEEKIDALNKKLELIFGDCILMPCGTLGTTSQFVDFKKWNHIK